MARNREKSSASRSWYSASLISSSSNRICNSISCSLISVSSFNSWSAIFWIWLRMNLKTVTGASKMSSIRNIRGDYFRSSVTALELEPDVNEVVWRPGAGVSKGELIFVLRSDLFYFLIEFSLTIALNQKRRVHDHAVANRFVCARCHGRVSQQRIHFPNV